MISKYAKWLKQNKDQADVPLDLPSYQAYLKKMEEENDKYEALFDPESKDYVDQVIKMDFESEISQEEKDARTKSWIEKVNQDLFLEETMAILHDVIALADVSVIEN